MHPATPGVTTDIIFTNHNAVGITEYTTVTNELAEIFLQTRGAKAIAGVFAFASILVTCIQVGCNFDLLFSIQSIYCPAYSEPCFSSLR